MLKFWDTPPPNGLENVKDAHLAFTLRESVINQSSNKSNWDPVEEKDINISIFPLINLITFHMLIWIGHAPPLGAHRNPNLITNYTVGGWLDPSSQPRPIWLLLMWSTFHVQSPRSEDTLCARACVYLLTYNTYQVQGYTLHERKWGHLAGPRNIKGLFEG